MYCIVFVDTVAALLVVSEPYAIVYLFKTKIKQTKKKTGERM